VNALKDPRAPSPGADKTLLFPEAAMAPVPSGGFQIARLPHSTADFRQQLKELREQVVTILTPGGSGSGFYIADGLLLTNHHVISGYGDVKIRFLGGREITGQVLSSNARRDVALVKTESQTFRGLPLRLESPPETSPVYVIGSPLGQEQEGSISAGIISAFRTSEEGPIIQSDVGVTHGNSGGPMFDEKGNVIALVVSGRTGTQVNFFIPIADALKVLSIDPSLPAGTAPLLTSASR
jgi:serine protease Do